MAKLKTINIKGKEYVPVHVRIMEFHKLYPKGKIESEYESVRQTWVVKSKVTPDCEKPDRYYTGLAQEIIGEKGVNKTSALENAETSAVGRALGMLNIGIDAGIASADEMKKVQAETIDYSTKIFVFGAYEDKHILKDLSGSQWIPKKTCWAVDDTETNRACVACVSYDKVLDSDGVILELEKPVTKDGDAPPPF